MNVEVSVVFITYNHVRYVENAISSIVSQVTNFPFEIIMADDYSSDGTRECLDNFMRDHKANYVLSYADKNQGVNINMYEAFNKCRGRYIALLEGDDVWTDIYKLQKQYDFMETHTEYSMVTHLCSQMNKAGEITHEIAKRFCPDIVVYKISDLSTVKSAGHTSSYFFRSHKEELISFSSYLLNKKYCPGDCAYLMFILQFGEVYMLKEVMSCYRFVSEKGEGNWNSLHNDSENAFFFYMIAKQQEVIAKKCGIILDLFEHKCVYFYNGLRTLRKTKKVRLLFSVVMMFIMTKRKKALLSYVIKRKWDK